MPLSGNPTDPLSLVGVTLEGKYAVDAYVARGGFGVVYRGQHLRLRRPVAIKVLRLDAAPDTLTDKMRSLFEVEACLVAQLEHPAIVRVLDYGVCAAGGAGDVPWMAAEWVDGATLADDLRDRQPDAARSPAACFELLRPVFEALIYAHALGIVHRDLKPANLIFTSPEDGGADAAARVGIPRLKLLDFGIAKVMEPEEAPPLFDTSTRSSHVSFSVKYGAPEQFGNARTGPWTDIYAMALVLTEMLVGRRAYQGTQAMEFLAEAMSERRPTPGRHGVAVGPWEPVLAKALALRPSDRFDSMAAFLAALAAEVPQRAAHPSAAPREAADDIEVVDVSTLSPSLVPPRPSAPRRARLAALLAIGAVVSLVAAGFARLGRAPANDAVTAPPLSLTAARPAPPVAPRLPVPAPASHEEPTSPPQAVAVGQASAARVPLAARRPAASHAHTPRSRRLRQIPVQ